MTGLLCEQLVLYGYSLCIIDPEGDYTSLEALPGVVVFGGADPLPRPATFLHALRHADVSIVVDLSHTPQQEQLEYLHTVLPALATFRRHTGLPHRIIVDEAHYSSDDPHAPDLLDLDASGYTLVTYRASKLRGDFWPRVSAIIVTRESDPKRSANSVRCAARVKAPQPKRMGATIREPRPWRGCRHCPSPNEAGVTFAESG